MAEPTEPRPYEWNPDPRPMPAAPVWHCHVPRLCGCIGGLSPDENWAPEFLGDERADPPWPGEGWLVCGFCDGDGWYWQRLELDPSAGLFFVPATNRWEAGHG